MFFSVASKFKTPLYPFYLLQNINLIMLVWFTCAYIYVWITLTLSSFSLLQTYAAFACVGISLGERKCSALTQTHKITVTVSLVSGYVLCSYARSHKTLVIPGTSSFISHMERGVSGWSVLCYSMRIYRRIKPEQNFWIDFIQNSQD